MKALRRIVSAALIAAGLTANAKAEGLELHTFYTYSQPELNRAFCDNLNDKYSINERDWNLRPEWIPIAPPGSLSIFGGGIDVNLSRNISLTFGAGYSNLSTKYAQLYVFDDPDYGPYKDFISREEEDDLWRISLGGKYKIKLFKPLSLNCTGAVDYYNLTGDVYLTRERGVYGSSTTYLKDQSASYSGWAFGGSANVGIELKIIEELFIEASVGGTLATVDAKGTETTKFRPPRKELKNDYNPSFDLSGVYFKAGVTYAPKQEQQSYPRVRYR
jgi:hypothetical protein